jgi:hypothetical protein
MTDPIPVPVTEIQPESVARRAALRAAKRLAQAAGFEIDLALVGKGSVDKAVDFLAQALERAKEALGR